MHSMKMDLIHYMAKNPKLKEFGDILAEKIPDYPDSESRIIEFEADLNAICELDLEYDLASIKPALVTPSEPATPVVAPATGSQRITIRIPAATLAAYKAKAELQCIPYQRLVNRTLRAAMADWRH